MDEINYEEIVQENLRNVVKQALTKASKEGLPGAHHFYISFRTDFPGVNIPAYLRERHPEEITVVIQYQFWGLEVDEKGFGVTLSFSDSQERIYVPFLALLSFMDPHAKFGLQFTPPPVVEEAKSKEQKKPAEGEKKDNVVTLDSFRKK